jgi:diaminopimelate decarboxylase/aspartate kinase
MQKVNQHLQKFKAAHPRYELWVEPGRFLAASAGVLLTTVTQFKGKDNIGYIGVETGMNSLIRPALYGSSHTIVNLSKLGRPNSQQVNIVGPICESADMLGANRRLPKSQEGDIILIANTGAYGYVMSSNYNLRPPAEEVVI